MSNETSENKVFNPPTTSSISGDTEITIVFGGIDKQVALKVNEKDGQIVLDQKVIEAIEETINDMFQSPRFLLDILECYSDSYEEIKVNFYEELLYHAETHLTGVI